MTLRWTTHDGGTGSWSAFDGRAFAVGQVVRYDEPRGWMAFRCGERIEGGPWATANEAKAAIEALI